MQIQGSVAAPFSAVRDAFAEVLDEQPGTGASFAIWHDGEWVVDLWGGYADAAHTRPWQRDTLVMPYSVTKPIAALCVLTLVDRGLVELDAPMQRYWPELRAAATVRDVLSHRAGLVVLDEDAPEEAFYDWDLMCSLLARQEPTWPPGSAQGESALFYGHLLGQVVRAVDGRTLGARSCARRSAARTTSTSTSGSGDAELARVADLTGFGDDFRASQEGYPDLYYRAIEQPTRRAGPAGRQRRAVAPSRDPGRQRPRHRPRGRRVLRRALARAAGRPRATSTS